MKTLLKKLALFAFVIALFSCTENQEEKPKGLITDEEAKEMRALYLNHQYKYINDELQRKYPDVKALDHTVVAFELPDLKKYIAMVEHYSKEKGYLNLGLLVKFAAKPDEDQVPKSNVYIVPIQFNNRLSFLQNSDYDVITGLPAYNKGSSGNPPGND